MTFPTNKALKGQVPSSVKEFQQKIERQERYEKRAELQQAMPRGSEWQKTLTEKACYGL